MSDDPFLPRFEQIASLIGSHRRFLVLGHVDPDGDCLGSVLALAQYLVALGKEVACFAPGEIPDVYTKLPAYELFVHETHLQSFGAEVVFSLDVPTMKRTTDFIAPDNGLTVVNIDHHPTNEQYGDINVVDEKAAATAVLMYRLLAAIAPGMITAEMADCLFVGILLDTGGFRFQNTNAEAFATAALLVELGARSNELTHEFIHAKKHSTLKLLSMALESIEIHSKGRVATMELSSEMVRQSGGSLGDTEGFIDYAGAIDGIELCALFREIDPGRVRVSLRARNDHDVAAIAERYGGGGHRSAAGLVIEGDLSTAKSRLAHDLEQLLDPTDPRVR